MTVSRIIGAAALCAAIAMVGYVLLGRTPSYGVTALLADAGQIVPGDEVKIGAASIGTVTSVDLTGDGLAKLRLNIDDEVAPLRAGTTLAVRSTSLAGSANRYVTLTPGPPTAPQIEDGGAIPLTDTNPPVDIDAVINALDAPTRAGLRSLIRGAAQQYGSRSAQARASLQRLAPALSGSTAVLRQFALDRQALRGLIARGSLAAAAVASRRSELTDLVTNAGLTAQAVGSQSRALNQALGLLPSTLRKADSTFVDLRTTMDALDPLVAATKPATRNLAAFLARLRPLLANAVPTLGDLAPLVSTSGPDNDLTDLIAGLPALHRRGARTVPSALVAMDGSQPILDELRQYTPDIAAATARLDDAASYYDANGHYIRAQPSLFALGYDATTNQLTSRPDSQRNDGLQLGRGARCPGSATQAPPDHSAPIAAPGCSTSNTPPGP